MAKPQKRLIAISGPSCGGKGPLLAAARTFRSELEFTTFAVIKSKQSRGNGPRPDEIDIWDDPDYFRSREVIESLGGDRYVHAVSHGFPQVLDLERVFRAPTPVVVLEASHEITCRLPGSEYLRDVDVTTVFVSPLSYQDIQHLQSCRVNVAEYLKGLQVTRLMARAAFHQKQADDDFLADVAVRAADAVQELRVAHHFDHVLVGRAGEGSPDWNRDPSGRFLGPPQRDAAKTFETFVRLISGDIAPELESWENPPL